MATTREYVEEIFGDCPPGELRGMSLEVAEKIIKDENYLDLDSHLKDWAWNEIGVEMDRIIQEGKNVKPLI